MDNTGDLFFFEVSPEEAEDIAFDMFLNKLRKEFTSGQKVEHIYALNEKRIGEFTSVYLALDSAFKASGCNIYSMQCKRDVLVPSSCAISVEADDFKFYNREGILAFATVAELSDGVDIYPLTNGRVHMDLTFNDVFDRLDATKETRDGQN